MTAADFKNEKDIIVVQALLELTPTGEGGRKSSIISGYRPNHVFEYIDDKMCSTYIGEIQFDKTEMLPEEKQIVTVYFLNIPSVHPFLYAGRKWWIHEGSKMVGVGEIISVISK